MGIFRKFWRRDRGVSSQAVAAVVAQQAEPTKAMRLSDMALAEARGAYGEPLNPWKLPSPPPWIGGNDTVMALDRAGGPGIGDIYNWAVNGAFSEGLGFLGYPYLAELSQRPEYRRVSEIWASEATRKWIKLGGSTPERIDAIEKQLARFKIRDRFRRLAELDGFFGRGQLFVDLGHPISSPELAKPLIAKAKVKPRSIKNFKVVEPFWSYPGSYQSNNPLAPDFYIPRQWFVMNGDVHATRLLTIVGREMPDMLKPAYSFGGLSLSQMVKPYVDNWLRTRQSISDLLHSFSTMVLATDMSAILTGGAAKGLLDRLDLFNRARDNRGVMAINKESEELTNVSTPLGTLDKLQAQAQEQIASVSGIPLVVLLGVTPSGLNASSDGEIRTFYATIKAYQERVFRDPLQRVLDLVQYDLDGQCDETLTFEFLDLWETPEQEKANIRKSDADMDVAYVGAGIVSNEEVRARIVQDEDSPYFGMELDDNAPEMPGEEEEGPDGPDDDGGPGDDDADDSDDDGPKQAQDAAKWEEGKHPRAKNGQFGSGGGGGASKPAEKPAEKPAAKPEAKSAPAAKPAKPTHPKVAAILGDEGVTKLRELIADPNSKAADVLAALKPLDDAQREMTPTLPHDAEPTEEFWNSRTYKTKDGEDMNAAQARSYLEGVAAAYAEADGGVGVKREKRARFLLGPPAAGKSTSAERIASTEGYAIVDGDDAKKVIPEFDGGVGASAVHEESGKLSEQVLLDMLDKGDNVILPLVGGSPGSIERRIKLLESKGYTVTVDLVDVTEDNAARRMAGRALSSGRHISSGYFASIGDGPRRTYETLKGKYPNAGFGVIDGNGGPRDEVYKEATNHPTAKTGHRLFS